MEKEFFNENLSATEDTSVAFSRSDISENDLNLNADNEVKDKVRFERSFTAKLLLSDAKVKEFYVAIANKLLNYQKVKSRVSWMGVSFNAGRVRIAYIAIKGKTLCLYLALDPEEFSEGKYKAKNVGNVKKRAYTPTLLKIRSDGALRHALKLIAETAKTAGLCERKILSDTFSVHDFKTEGFSNLLSKGLIRVIKRTGNLEKDITANIDGADVEPSTVTFEDLKAENEVKKLFRSADEIQEAIASYGAINDLLTVLSDGDGRISVTERRMLRAVDEIWVRAVEDCVTALDTLIRNPNHFIAESEEVLPIELTKRISGRSVAHLARHTDYLSEDETGGYTPTKMLNVFREDSVLTYENKFLNTLINRLYLFVNRRYRIAKEYGVDEKLRTFEFEDSFIHGEGKGKIKISIEYSERDGDSVKKNDFTTTDLWKRVDRLNDVVTGYVNSSFAKTMERNFVRPPILRTNAIVKNKYFRECLALWEFIESYDDAGYGIVVDEKTVNVDETYVKQAYTGASLLYLYFRRNFTADFIEEENYSVKPSFNVTRERAMEYREETNYVDDYDGDTELLGYLDTAIGVALAADAAMVDEEEETTKSLVKSFHAKIRLADEDVKRIFVDIANLFLCRKGVKMRQSKRYAAFNKGRKTLARVTVSEKSLKLYLACDANSVAEKYRLTDVSDKRAFSDTPALLKVKSARSEKYAAELITGLLDAEGAIVSTKNDYALSVDDYAREPVIDMIAKGWIEVVESAPTFQSKEFRTGFGPSKNEISSVAATAVANEKDDSVIVKTEPSRPVAEEEASFTGRRIADTLDEIIRPDGNYERPTEYGVDDSSGFIEDEKLHQNGALSLSEVTAENLSEGDKN